MNYIVLGLQVVMLFYGLRALYTGRYEFTKENIMVGNRVRLGGFIMMLPLPIAFVAGFVIGSTGASLPDSLSLTGIELIIAIACLVIGLGIAATAPQSENFQNK